MRKWRVGTLSLGILLITLGVVMLIGLLNGHQYVEQIVKWWPVILIILGFEILGYIYFSRQEDPKVKYDVFSIFMIIIIGFASIGFYAITATGIIPQISKMVVSKVYSVQLPEERITVEPEIEKIIVKVPKYSLSIKGSKENEVVVLGDGEIFASTQEEAEAIMKKGQITEHLVGNTLIVQFIDVPRIDNFNMGARDINYTIFLPENKDIEIRHDDHYYSHLEIDGDAVKSDWLIDVQGRVEMTVSPEMNLSITATVSEEHRLTGNVNWDISTIPNKRTTVGNVKYQEGLHKLNIFCGEIKVNQIAE